MKRKPGVYLLVVMPTLLVGGMTMVLLLTMTYARIHNIQESAIPRLNGILITLPALLLWVPVALLLSNCVLHAIPRLRQLAEQYSANSGHPGFGESQRQLLKLVLAMAAVCLPLIFLGFNR